MDAPVKVKAAEYYDDEEDGGAKLDPILILKLKNN